MVARFLTVFCLLGLPALAAPEAAAPSPAWPPVTRECRPWTYWWWMGSAVTVPELARHAEVYGAAGLGGMHVIPIYAAENPEAEPVPFLSDRWMELLAAAVGEADRRGLGVDMTLGTGWPYGGPWVGPEEAAARAFFQVYALDAGQRLGEKLACAEQPEAMLKRVMAYAADGAAEDVTARAGADGTLDWSPADGPRTLVALFQGWTKQQVKRAAPGGEGNVLDHWSREKLGRYLARFDEAFAGYTGKTPRAFYLDSYEVYNQNWTDLLLDRFKERRGYDLADHFPALLGMGDPDTVGRVRSDYNETVGDLMLLDFAEPWAAWVRGRGSLSRYEAHGSPGNLLDLYAAADIPETEGFGREGSELLMTKFSSSAAHVAGRGLVASESCTWLDEHFQERPAAVKAEMDKLFLGGVNHALFHGTAYSPESAPWPGWLFYASTHVGPTNPWHRHLPEINGYLARCQSFLQAGRPDADILLYFPVYDLWATPAKDPPSLHRLTVHNTKEWLHTGLRPAHEAAAWLWDHGHDFDYVSDRQLAAADLSRYRAVVVPRCGLLPPDTAAALNRLADRGVRVVFLGAPPADVPGLGALDARRAALKAEMDKLVPRATVTEDLEAAVAGLRREAAVDHGVLFVRRRMDDGTAWFLVNRSDTAFDGEMPLSAGGAAAALFDPMTGRSGMIPLRAEDGGVRVPLTLEPGQSCVVRVYDAAPAAPAAPWTAAKPAGPPLVVDGAWSVTFTDGGPALPAPLKLRRPAFWTESPGTEAFSGTAVYRAEFHLSETAAAAAGWRLDLGDVRECAAVRVNGRDAGTAWMPPYRLDHVGPLPAGKNTLEVEVTNLAANRVAAMDRNGEKWQRAYFVNIDYKPFDAAKWPVLPSGLAGPVTLTPLEGAAQ